MPDLPCPPQLWPRFSTLLDELLDLPPPQRSEFLTGLSGQDADLRPWLMQLLARTDRTGAEDFMSGPSGLPAMFHQGDILGPYRLDALLGEGGMGQVWSATRDDEGPRRQVALKLLRPDFRGSHWHFRFGQERDVLAALSHPHIAQLYDAGISQAGHPYLVLECVTGLPITAYCRTRAATLEQRVALIIQVLDALSYAHARLIVHRDIKPSNVLVTAEGNVKLLDFGIAKLLDSQETAQLMLTQPAHRMATPGYGAPEQIAGEPVSVAADVFSAGVLLFEVLAGQRPFDRVPANPDAPAAPVLSRKAEAVLASSPEAARLPRLLRGDLDAITARALALSPTDRYPSAEAFARDLRRWRDGQPVSARNVAWPVVAAKFARRNRAAVSLTALLLLTLIGGSAAIAWQARRATAQAVRATHEAARATAISDFLIDLFKRGDPRGGGRAVQRMTAKELLDTGADLADAAFKDNPETEISLLGTLGDIYDQLAEVDRAHAAWTKRLDLARKLYGPTDPRLFDATLALAEGDATMLDHAASLKLLESIKVQANTQFADDLPRHDRWLFAHASALITVPGGRQEGLHDVQSLVAAYELHAPNDPLYLQALILLSAFQHNLEHYDDAMVTLLKYGRLAAARPNGMDPMATLTQDCNLALTHQRLGHGALADQFYQRVQDEAAKIMGDGSHWGTTARVERGSIASLNGQNAQAAAIFQQGLQDQASHGDTNAMSGYVRRFQAASLLREGQPALALPILQALSPTAPNPKAADVDIRRHYGLLGDALDQLGQPEPARALLLAARDAWARYAPPYGRAVLAARERWARFLLDHNDAAGAEAEFNRVLADAAGAADESAARAQAGLARVALARGDKTAADAVSAAALRLARAVTVEHDVRVVADIEMIRADILLALGRKAQAGALAKSALAAVLAYDVPSSARIGRARVLLDEAAQ
jgi:serine/threonine-protein kinase